MAMDASTIFFIITLIVLISNAVTCGIVRLFHICDPYRIDPDYYYPVRKLVSAYYFSIILLLPCLIHPYGEDALFYARCFQIGFFPVQSVCIISKYFKLNRFKYTEEIEMWFDFMLLLVMAIIAILDKDILVNYKLLWKALIGLLYCFAIAHQAISIIKFIKRSYVLKDTVSSFEDFPEIYKIGYIPLWLMCDLQLVLLFFAGNKWLLGSLFLMSTLFNTVILLIILNPQKRLRFEIVPEDIFKERKNLDITIEEVYQEVSESKETSSTPAAGLRAIADKMERVVGEQELFKNPHLTVNDVAEATGLHPLELREAGKFTGHKNFFDFINSFRMEYAQKYSKEHPEATKTEIATVSGFGSYRSFIRTAERYKVTAEESSDNDQIK